MKIKINEEVTFSFAGSTYKGTIIEIDKEKVLIKGLDGYKYPIGIDQIIKTQMYDTSVLRQFNMFCNNLY